MSRSAPNRPTELLARFVAATLLALTGIAQAAEKPSPPPGEITFDRYYVVELQGQRCGFARITRGQSASQMIYQSYLQINLSRSGTGMTIVSKTVCRQSLSGDLLSIRQTLVTNGMTTTKQAVVEDGQLVVTARVLGQEYVERFRIPDQGFKTEADVDGALRELLDKPGQKIAVKMLSVEAGGDPFIPITVEIVGPESIPAYGQAVTATRVLTSINLNGMEVQTTAWEDQQGTLASRVNFGGLDLYLRAASKDQAKKPSAALELTSFGVIMPKAPLKDPAHTGRAVYRLTLKHPASASLDLPQTDMQRTVAAGKNYLDLEVVRQDAKELAAVKTQQVPAELAAYLHSSLYLDWQHPSVRQAARQIAADSSQPWDVALALWKYVDATILIKNMEVYFDPASKVLASHQGDCTEHAVLLAALARARGLPARVVTGITQVQGLAGHEAAFGYHVWTEVWIGGTWVALDAALRQAPADVTHIALGVSALNSSEPLADIRGNLLPLLGNLQIEVLEQR